MTLRAFGKRQSPPPRPAAIDAVLVPKGAAASADIWAMCEALRMFIDEAMERGLFTLDELPRDAVAVFRAYELALALGEWSLGGWYADQKPGAEQVDQIVRGLRLVGNDVIADMLARLHAAATAGEALDSFKTAGAMGDPLIDQCSAWVRHSPQTRVLGDGQRDTVYKETMKQLGRCNPDYSRQRLADDHARQSFRRKPLPLLEGPPCTIEALIAEMQARYG